MKKQYFGTDGIRGKVGHYPITADFILKLGWAAGNVLADSRNNNHVLIGKDTRISGYMFESALEAGLAAAGVNSQLMGPMPTPAIAYLTRTFRAQCGIVISASHNPYDDNGIKFFCPKGLKLADDIELAIESYLDKPMTTKDSASLGKATRIDDAGARYIEFCKSTIPAFMDFSGVRIVIDCAHGATYHTAPYVFEELGATVSSIGVEPDGLNINHQCGATHLDTLQQKVLEEHADYGIAFDGDGDRVMMVDHKGEIVDGDEILFIIAKSRAAKNHLRQPIVGTLMSNLGLEHALQQSGIDFVRANVGDRYVMELLKQKGGVLGGENSGHVICLDRSSTGDGIIAALQVMVEMHESGKTLHELKNEMNKYPQVLVNVKIEQRFNVAEHAVIQAAKQDIEHELGDDGRVLLRASGTEPLIRVMIEGTESNQVTRLANKLADVVKDASLVHQIAS
ncbi:MAG TPA: phosphoglucosamine mutase [Crenotrichaceae bacterium]|nr:phosphoglucosamine mutase [Crenotrichaceae bacterium]